MVRLADVGVAGIHRLLDNVSIIKDADVVVCVAGMDGGKGISESYLLFALMSSNDSALPSVVGGLVTAPVIAVPTSVGK